MGVILHQQAVLADFDLANIEHTTERREHRNFVFELGQFRGRYRRKTRVAQRGVCSRVAHGQVQGLQRGRVSDAAAQFSRFFQRYKRAALLIQQFARAGIRFVKLASPYRVLYRLAGQSQEFTSLMHVERKRPLD